MKSKNGWRSRSLGTGPVGVALVLWLCAIAVGSIPAVSQEGRESHHWIVLLDISASAEQREKVQSEALQREGYRLRNETLSLLQTLLAARRIKELERRDDRLSVYVFGEGVERIQELSYQPLRWPDIRDPRWWERQIPRGLGARTNYFEALRWAVEDFKDDPLGTAQHLVLISDGELDVGETNRNPGAPPGREELDVYRNLLRRDTEPLNWLYDHRVQVHTLAVDEALSSYNDSGRQKQIQNTLYDYQFAGATPLERARALVEDLAGRIGPEGKLVEGEGPYVLSALAAQFDGSSRSVRYDNVLDVLWETLFPEQVSRRILPLGTNKVVIFAPRQAPITFTVEKEGRPIELSLRYDAERDSYRVEPPGPWPELQVNHQATSQYITWMVRHPNLREVDPRRQLVGERTFSIVPVTNVAFRWREDRPPREALGDEPVPLALDLVWFGEQPEPSRDAWRRHLQEISLVALGKVELPDGSTEQISFSTSVPEDDSQAVLRLDATYAAHLEGDHEVTANVTLGRDEESPEIKAEPIRFNVLSESPLSVPDRFLLHLRPWEGGQPGEALAFALSEADLGVPQVLWVDSEETVTVVFEWWGKIEEGCQGVERLRLRLPEFDRNFGRDENQIGDGERQVEGDRLVCYRTPGIRVEPERWNTPLTVTAEDGLKALKWRWKIDRPIPRWKKILWGLFLALLLALLLLAYLKQDWIRRQIAKIQAPFPLALDLPDGTLEWSGKRPKRFLLVADLGGQLYAEQSRRKPSRNEAAVEIEPIRKQTYKIRAMGRRGWNLQRIGAGGEASHPRPLSQSGETVTLLELTRGHRLELQYQGATVTLRHRVR